MDQKTENLKGEFTRSGEEAQFKSRIKRRNN